MKLKKLLCLFAFIAVIAAISVIQQKRNISNIYRFLFAPPMPFGREPIERAMNPYWQEHINRDRIYDFYAKQALHYGKMQRSEVPAILPQYPGTDGGWEGHWGNQSDERLMRDGRIREMNHGSMVSGVFRGAGKTIPRGVSVSLGDGFYAVFNQDSLQFQVAWKGSLAKWSDVRRGFMHGTPIGGDELIPLVNQVKPAKDARYLGLYRQGERVVFSYLENGKNLLRAAAVQNGKVVESTLDEVSPGQPQWPMRIKTRGSLGEGQPYAIDTLTLPYDNPWKSLFFVSGLDFLSEKRIAICTIHGEVWVCDVSDQELSEITWKRYAAGLHQPLGLKVADGLVHVMCRDQIVALHDLNGDDEADFYECVSNVHKTSAHGHDFITGLQRDSQGRWYFASGNQGVCRVSADGEAALDVLGTGLRNPDGLGVSPDGKVVLVGVAEGNWTPASAICDLSTRGHFGNGGPKTGDRGYVPPMLYLPRGADNSCGGQVYIDSERWGPVKGHWIHFSNGFATHFLVLREVIDGQSQAAAVPLRGEFLSGSHRGRFSPHSGHLYVAGAQGWQNYGVKDGSLQRVRFTGGGYPYPIGYETRENGVLLTFADPQPAEVTNAANWFAQQWNYLYGPAYGSPEYSVRYPNRVGHDRLDIRSVHRIGDGKHVFVEIPQLQPVNQLHLHFAGLRRIELFATLHRLGKPFTDIPGYERIEKTISRPASSSATAAYGPKALFNACAVCHHETKEVVGSSLRDIRRRYAGNPDGIVRFAMDPPNTHPNRAPMPSFKTLGEANLRIIAEYILSTNR